MCVAPRACDVWPVRSGEKKEEVVLEGGLSLSLGLFGLFFPRRINVCTLFFFKNQRKIRRAAHL